MIRFAPLALALIVGSCNPGPVPVVEPPQPGPSQAGDISPAATIDAINAQRRAHGLAPYRAEIHLQRAAEVQAADQARHGQMSHVGSDGSTFTDRITGAGYRYSGASENVAWGQTSAEMVVADWMASPGHRANILGPYTEIGVYAAPGPPDGRPYWCADFGSPGIGGPSYTCTLRYPAGYEPTGAEHLTVQGEKRWPNGSTIKVEFLGGSPAVQARVMGHANTWSRYANIRFAQVPRGQGQVRVSFNQPGYWSTVGTDCLSTNPGEATLNLQGFDDEQAPPPESEWHRVVRHEFGHALGNLHEQQRPEAVARLNPAKVIQYFAATQGWSAEMIRQQILTPMSMAGVIAGPEDDASIMMYSFDASLTLDGKPIVGGTEIDAEDQAVIAKAYPPGQTPPTPPVTPKVATPGAIVFTAQSGHRSTVQLDDAGHARITIYGGVYDVEVAASTSSAPAPGPDDFTRDNLESLLVFVGTLALAFLAIVAYDVWVYLKKGSARTISWSVVLATRDAPFWVILFVACFFTIVGGLLTHFWFYQPPPL